MDLFLVPYVVVDDLDGVVADGAGVRAGAPEVSLRVAEPEFRLAAKELVAQVAFEQLQGPALRHGGRQLKAAMDVLRQDAELSDGDVVARGGLAQNFLAKIFILLLPQHSVSVFRAPLQVGHIDADFVRVSRQVHSVCLLARTAHATSIGTDAWRGVRSPRLVSFFKKKKIAPFIPTLKGGDFWRKP